MAFQTREEWLTTAAELIIDERFNLVAGAKQPSEYRISVGWPKGSRGSKKAVAQCFSRAASSDGHNEIFVSPECDDPVQVLDHLTHELIHASDDCKSGHRGYFKRVAVGLGLTGPMTATTAGPELRSYLESLSTLLGPFPHAAMLDRKKKVGSRQKGIRCNNCGFTFRTTKKWKDRIDLPGATCLVCDELSTLEEYD